MLGMRILGCLSGKPIQPALRCATHYFVKEPPSEASVRFARRCWRSSARPVAASTSAAGRKTIAFPPDGPAGRQTGCFCCLGRVGPL
eukprot:8277137-Alexandrium_andersonii.AAC.1